jgi:hypothetical protein
MFLSPWDERYTCDTPFVIVIPLSAFYMSIHPMPSALVYNSYLTILTLRLRN